LVVTTARMRGMYFCMVGPEGEILKVVAEGFTCFIPRS